MAWANRLQQAAFRDVPFDVLKVSDANSRGIAISQPPFSDKSLWQDMGSNVSETRFSVRFDGENYEDKLFALLNALDQGGPGKLIHPIYGEMQALPSEWTIEHSPDDVDAALLELTFKIIQGASVSVDAAQVTPSLVEASTQVMLQPVASLEAVQNSVSETLPVFPEAIRLPAWIDRLQTDIAQIRRTISDWTGVINDLTAPPDWIGQMLDDVADWSNAQLDLPGQRSYNAWLMLYQRVRSIFGLDKPDAPQAVQQVWQTLKIAATITVVDAIFERDLVEAELTPVQLVAIRDQVRADINEQIALERERAGQPTAVSSISPSIDAVEQVRSLKEAALAVHVVTESLLQRRPPLVVRTVTLMCTIRQLAHRLYGDHRLSIELMQLNPQLVNPALIRAGTEVYAYAT